METHQDRGAILQIMSVTVNSNLQRQSTLEWKPSETWSVPTRGSNRRSVITRHPALFGLGVVQNEMGWNLHRKITAGSDCAAAQKLCCWFFPPWNLKTVWSVVDFGQGDFHSSGTVWMLANVQLHLFTRVEWSTRYDRRLDSFIFDDNEINARSHSWS